MDYRSCNGVIYTIKPGDTLYKISARYGVPIALILRANQYIDIYNLRIGDRICIPANGMPERDVSYTIGQNDTIQDILKRFNLTRKEFFEANPVNQVYLKPGSTVKIPKMPRELREEDATEKEENIKKEYRENNGMFDGVNLKQLTEEQLHNAYNKCH